ncbi:MAG: PQQ-binding-like beta-propeller repeat protein [Halobacteriaceae archaeon]
MIPSRRTLLAGLASGALTATAGCGSVLPGSSDGSTTQPTVPPDADPGEEAWRHPFSRRPYDVVRVADGYVASLENQLVALDTSGEVTWERSLAVYPVASLAGTPEGDLLVISGEYGGFGGASNVVLHRLAPDGSYRWEQPVDATTHLRFLAVGGGRVYASTSDDVIGSGGHQLFALSLDDGGVRWTTDAGVVTGHNAVATPDGVAVLDRTVTRYGDDGSVRWETAGRYQRRLFRDPETGRLYAPRDDGAGGYRLHALAPADGSVVWRGPAMAGVPDRVEASPDGLLVSADGGAVALSRTGEERWRRGPEPAGRTSAVLADGVAYLTVGATARAVGFVDGVQRWTAALSGTVDGHAVAVGETAAFLDGRSIGPWHLRGFDVETGDPVWRSERVTTTLEPLAGDGRVYAVDQASGDLVALRL